MAETAPSDGQSAPGFLARNNELLGSLGGIVALVVSIALGAGLMLGTGTRGVAAILTVVLVAGGTFTLLYLLLGAVLRSLTPEAQWQEEEDAWRESRGLAPLTPEDAEKSRQTRKLVLLGASAAVLAGLALALV
jgi:hypothetical protein